jgi:hypothetical protein
VPAFEKEVSGGISCLLSHLIALWVSPYSPQLLQTMLQFSFRFSLKHESTSNAGTRVRGTEPTSFFSWPASSCRQWGFCLLKHRNRQFSVYGAEEMRYGIFTWPKEDEKSTHFWLTRKCVYTQPSKILVSPWSDTREDLWARPRFMTRWAELKQRKPSQALVLAIGRGQYLD